MQNADVGSKKVHERKSFINTKELDGNLEGALMGNLAFTVYAQTALPQTLSQASCTSSFTKSHSPASLKGTLMS